MSLPYVCNFMVVYMLLGLTMRIRVVQQYQMNRYFHLSFLILYDLLYCAQFIPNNSLYTSRSYIQTSVFLFPCVYRKGYVKERVSGNCSLYLSLIKKLLNCIAFWKTLQIVMKQRSRVKRSIPPKKTCNNYSAKEPIQVSSDTSLFYYDFMMIVQ